MLQPETHLGMHWLGGNAYKSPAVFHGEAVTGWLCCYVFCSFPSILQRSDTFGDISRQLTQAPSPSLQKFTSDWQDRRLTGLYSYMLHPRSTPTAGALNAVAGSGCKHGGRQCSRLMCLGVMNSASISKSVKILPAQVVKPEKLWRFWNRLYAPYRNGLNKWPND